MRRTSFLEALPYEIWKRCKLVGLVVICAVGFGLDHLIS